MIRSNYHFEIITPCFCAGADPNQAEIRASSIRGQLRWWFRVLGGFKSMSHMTVRDQEAMVFGSTAGNKGNAGNIVMRISSYRLSSEKRDGQALGHPNFSDPAYLTFPIQTRERQGQRIGDSSRGVLLPGGSFSLEVLWRGANGTWPDVEALVAVLGHLGALGFRGRRAMGALAFKSGSANCSLNEALQKFARPGAVSIYSLPSCNKDQVISKLGGWLRKWRQHGRSQDLDPGNAYGQPPENAGFRYAKTDHDIGYKLPSASTASAYRPALGLPIIQRAGAATNNWEWEWNQRTNKGEGRFASPVLLRPHRDPDGNWRGLVIFVEARKWPSDKNVFINGRACAVSLDLYEAMKLDNQLKPFP
jgi:CRISPR-associated protein Cmr1